MRKMNKSIILHLDMNSYFASVEQQANPFLRGKPVGICAYLSKNGCIIASSIEAKKLGIKTGCRVSEARKIYPSVVLIENNPDKYRTVTAKIFAILREYSDSFEPYSIDEAFLDLTGWVKDFAEAEKLALTIKQRVKNEVGDWLKMSMGLSYTRFLAKLCSDAAGPDELLMVQKPVELSRFYQALKLTDVWGIGEALALRLNRLGIFNLEQLRNYPVENLIRALDKNGYFLWARINGLVGDLVNSDSQIKSLGHSYCLPKKTTDKKYLSAILLKLAEKVGRRLRSKKLQANLLSVNWSYVNGGGFGKNYRLAKPVKFGFEIFNQAARIFNATVLKDKVYFLAVGVSGLQAYSRQLSLFKEDQKNDHLNESINNLNDRYGEFVLYRGRLWGLKKQAVDRIGFRKVELDHFDLID